jgi:hypothetical protein
VTVQKPMSRCLAPHSDIYIHIFCERPVDVMHLNGFFKRYILPLCKGGRPLGDDDKARLGLPLSEAMRERVDKRYQLLPVPSGLCSRSRRPFQHTGSMTTYDFQVMFSMYGKVLFHDIFANPGIYQVLCGLQDVMRCILCRKVDVSLLSAVQSKIVQVLVAWEKLFPKTELPCTLHLFVHLPSQMKRFGPVRLCWMYCFERFMNLISTFAKKRSSVGAAIMKMYCLSRGHVAALTDEARERLAGFLSENRNPFIGGLQFGLNQKKQAICKKAMPDEYGCDMTSPGIQRMIAHIVFHSIPAFATMWCEYMSTTVCAVFGNKCINGFNVWLKSNTVDVQEALQDAGLTRSNLSLRNFGQCSVNAGLKRKSGIRFTCTAFENYQRTRSYIRPGQYVDSSAWFTRSTPSGTEFIYGRIMYIYEISIGDCEETVQVAIIDRYELYDAELGQWDVFLGETNGHRILYRDPDHEPDLVCANIFDLKRLCICEIPTDDLEWCNYFYAIEVGTSGTTNTDFL